jgi:hypothetical protein
MSPKAEELFGCKADPAAASSHHFNKWSVGELGGECSPCAHPRRATPKLKSGECRGEATRELGADFDVLSCQELRNQRTHPVWGSKAKAAMRCTNSAGVVGAEGEPA